jgi:glycosyltransferase involved in cell wall biosynthesis
VGDAGLLVDPGDGHELRDAIVKIAADKTLASELGERGRERVRRFTWQKAAREMEEIFLEILAHNDRPGAG